MQLTTSVELPKNLPQINHEQQLMVLGSCFAENMGERLKQLQFKANINPFGILYNPLSIATALVHILEPKLYTDADLFEYNGCWHSAMHHGCFSSSDKATTLASINARIKEAHQQLSDTTEWLILTFGTAYVYTQKEDNRVVSNCHKLPERYFNRGMLEVNEIVIVYEQLLKRLREKRPNLKVLFTVSPIRHIRDGLHANQLSKSTLLLVIDKLCKMQPDSNYYFPSYEIMIDELRDYRFYADDFVHPSNLAIEYIWQRFSSTFFSSNTKNIMQECEKIDKLLQHRPLFPDSDEYKSFLRQTVLKIEQLKRKYPYLEFCFDIPQP